MSHITEIKPTLCLNCVVQKDAYHCLSEQECSTIHSSKTISVFADDTTAVTGPTTEKRTRWCSDNNLDLNRKTRAEVKEESRTAADHHLRHRHHFFLSVLFLCLFEA